MKKLSVLCMVLVTVLVLGTVGFGAELYPYREDKGDSHSLAFEVIGVVEPYASMYFIDDGPQRLELWWDGSREEYDEALTFFMIKSNTPIALAMEFGPLKNYNPYHKTNFFIDTTVQIDRLNHNGEWANRLNGTVTKEGKVANGTFYAPWIQTVQKYDYRMKVSGALKDIHDQGAGKYETEIILTISGYPAEQNQ